MKYSELRAALEKGPTPGEWQTHANEVYAEIDSEYHPVSVCVPYPTCRENYSCEVNAKYIAACDPETIGALLAERDEFRDRLEGAANYIDKLGGDSKPIRAALAHGENEA